MLKNYFKTAFRNLIKQKVYTGINVLGLAVSIAACILIVLYVKHELSYDKFVADGDRIYKLVLARKYPNHVTNYSIVPHSFAKAMKSDFPEVESTLQLFGPNKNAIITYKSADTEIRSFEENFFLQADSSFFNFFDLDFIAGDKKTSLSSPNQVIISESTALKYFGKEDPMGKIIGGDLGENKITGVFKDFPENSHLRFNLLGSLAGPQYQRFINSENYTSFDSHTYIKLNKGADPHDIEDKLPKLVDAYAAARIEHDLGKSWADYKKAGNGYTYTLQPLLSIHLDPTNLEWTISPSGNQKYVYILSSIALLIVVIACINFMNLATARAAERGREVGVRKVMGSYRSQLVVQFLTESFILSFTSTVIAVAGSVLLLAKFNDLVEKQLRFDFSLDLVLGLAGVAALVGFLAGIYPAFVLSGYDPVTVMRGNFGGKGKGAGLRNGLVVFQFMISIVLIVSTLVVGQQMHFIQQAGLGFDKSQMLMIKRSFALERQNESFINEIKRLDEVRSVSASSAMVGNRDDVNGESFLPEGSDEVLTVKAMTIDDEFGNDIGFEMLEGRSFSKETNDSLNIILNETAAHTLGLPDPVGRKMVQNDEINGVPVRKVYTIIGVVKNFHFQSLRDEITPLVVYNRERNGQHSGLFYIAIRVKPGAVKEAIVKIEHTWKEFVPAQPFQYEFLEENLKEGYAEEERSGKMFAVFSGLAIVIACVGLFGLSAYTATLRTKEIGIRKVMGSSVGQVVILLSKDFTKLVLIAFVLAVPLSWWLMHTWLSGFAYRINLTAQSFVVAGAVAVIISWITTSYQSIKAAIVNPIKSLRGQ